MDKDILGFIAVCVFLSPLIVLTVTNMFKTSRKLWRAIKDEEGEKQLEQDLVQSSTLVEPVHEKRAASRLTGATIMVILLGAGIGALFSIFSHLIYIVFLFPLLMGFAGGLIIDSAVRIGKVRKTSQLMFLSLLMAITIYGAYHYGRYIGLRVQMSFHMFPGLSAAMEDKNLKMAKAVVEYALKQETGHSGFVGYMLLKAKEGVSVGRFYGSRRTDLGSILTWLYWTLEFGIILWVTFSLGRKQTRSPFCEFCGNWCTGEKHLGGTAAANESLLSGLIKQRDFGELGKLLEENAEVPSLEIYLQGCQICDQGPSRLIVRRASQSSKGTLQFAEASRTVLSTGDRIRLLNPSGGSED